MLFQIKNELKNLIKILRQKEEKSEVDGGLKNKGLIMRNNYSRKRFCNAKRLYRSCKWFYISHKDD